MTTEELRKAEAAYKAAFASSDALREARNAAVRQAIVGGMTHAQIAEATGLTRGRIGQIAIGPTEAMHSTEAHARLRSTEDPTEDLP